MNRSDSADWSRRMDRVSRRESRRRAATPPPWYLRTNTWVAVVIGVAVLGTILIIGLTIALVAGEDEPGAQGIVASTQPAGSVIWNTPPPSGVSMISAPVVEPWGGTERFTVLIMGIDRRPGEPGSAFRTDTMILASIDPATQSLGILSIPRDLYVVVPGYDDRHRINEALALGELQRVGYGPELARQTVQLNFGIRVHDFITVEFEAFTTIVDAIGGIDVNVPEPINDPYYPDQAFGYDPFYIDAGLQHMDGATALKYARTRHASNDFDRARRQQQVIYAIRDKVLNAGMWPTLLTQAGTLWQELSTKMKTGLDFLTALQLAMYLKDIPGENIKSDVVDARYTSNYTTAGGAMVLIPNQAALAELMVQVFGSTYNQ